MALDVVHERELVANFRIHGDLEALRVPREGSRLDPERLWEHTCCELSMAPPNGEGYVEWNFSPTGQVARFEFESYRRRHGMAAPATARVSVATVSDQLRLQARVPLTTSMGDAIRISTTAVIEDATGQLSHWALHHPCERPDFHHAGGFVATLLLSPSPRILDTPSKDD